MDFVKFIRRMQGMAYPQTKEVIVRHIDKRGNISDHDNFRMRKTNGSLVIEIQD